MQGKKPKKNEKNTKKTCFFPEKKHEMKKTVFFTTLCNKTPGIPHYWVRP